MTTESFRKVTIEIIRSFGMIPEFIGRLPIIFTLKGLDKDMLVKILKEPKNAILKPIPETTGAGRSKAGI